MRKLRNASLAALGLILLISLLAIWAPTSDNPPILVTGSDLVGCRSSDTGGGVVTSDGWTQANGGFEICWTISFDGTNWNYSYTLRNFDDTVPVLQG